MKCFPDLGPANWLNMSVRCRMVGRWSFPRAELLPVSELQTEARVLIALGPDAVPYLLPWVMNDNLALRYVAVYALEQITGEIPYLAYFDHADHGENRARAIDVWRKW